MTSLEITDVTLRDGLQLEARVLSVDEKLQLLAALDACGYARLEITSFVHPKWLPQFADAEAFVTAAAAATPEKRRAGWMAFVPNERGLERLVKFPIPWVSAFVATTETFNGKNVNADIATTIASLRLVVEGAKAAGRRSRLYVSTVFGCPYEGNVPVAKALDVLARVADLGPDEIALSDTIGVAVPAQVSEVVRGLAPRFPVGRLALHLHNTYGLAAGNALAGASAGVTKFDGSTGGIGGCPYAKGATGNVASEELLWTFHRAGLAAKPTFEPIRDALAFLDGTAKLPVRSRLFDIWQKGGKPYGE